MHNVVSIIIEPCGFVSIAKLVSKQNILFDGFSKFVQEPPKKFGYRVWNPQGVTFSTFGYHTRGYQKIIPL